MKDMRLRYPSLLLVFSLVATACGRSSSNPTGTNDASSQDEPLAPEAASSDDTGSSAPSDSAAADSTVEAATGDAQSEDAPTATCGDPPARYTVLAGANAGLVRDNVTGLVWMNADHGGGEPPQTQGDATTYCTGRGMRLPTKDEALALAANFAPCAFGQWSTWTSTAAAGGDAWTVDYLGEVSPQVANNFPNAVLCVKDAADP
jgi:hypothetical protein